MICIKCDNTEFEVKLTPEGGFFHCKFCGYPQMIEQVSVHDLFRFRVRVDQLKHKCS